MAKQTKIKLLLLTFIMSGVHTLNILGVFPYQGRSHFFVFQPYLEELARRGHSVTVISHFPQTKALKNYRDISLANTTKIMENAFSVERSYKSLIEVSFYLMNTGVENCKIMLANKEVQNLWKNKIHFDVAVVEQFNSDCALGLAYKLGTPVVGTNSHVLMPYQYERFGIHYNPSYMTFQFLEGGTKPTLFQRIERTIFHHYYNFIFEYLSQRTNQNTLAQYFDDIPPLNELAREIKIMLFYHNFVLSGPNILPSNVKEVGGYHVAQPKELRPDVKKFIEESEHGVIYISFGSMLKAAATSLDKIEAILGAVAELPQRVIWKWEEGTLPGNPRNIFISNWLPQNDILAHPKVLAFYSHCGQLGTTEAIYHGVPVVGMPVFGDQPANAAAVEESGLGVQIQIQDLTKENLLGKLRTVLNPEFRKRVKFISKAWNDRPVKAMDSAIFWTEFAAKYSNITFRSRSVDVPLYQYLYLDVIAVLGSISVISVFVVFNLLVRLCTSKRENDKKNKLKRK